MTDKTILAAVEAEYERRRTADREEETRRLRKAVDECPEIAELRAVQQSLVRAAVQAVLHEGDSARVSREMAETRDKIAALLEANGHPRDWLEPVYQCAVCRDTGFTWDPPRVPCACRSLLQRRIALSTVGIQTDGETFVGYRTDIFPDDQVIPGLNVTQRAEMRLVRDRLAAWTAAAPAEGQHTVLLQGPSGLGKTYLLRCIANAFAERGIPCVLTRAYALVEAARKRVFSENDAEWEAFLGADILLIDDLGSEPLFQNITIEHLYELIETRQLAGRTTVVSTNLSQDDLRARYTERIASRLTARSSCLIVSLSGEDVRRRR
ncbi:MAG: ATP-binding protein [Clostridia bacterium]|nr:ATP-binding protein [Clostridia bacterium]